VTPGYAPLEQYSGEARQGPWSDLYAVGATLYACITGRAPTDAATRSAAQQESDADPLVPAVTAGAGRYSQPLLEAVDWALALRARDRPQDATEFAARLEQSTVKPARIAPEVRPEIEQPTQVASPVTPVSSGAPTQLAATIALSPTEGGRPRPWWRTRTAQGVGATLAVLGLITVGVLLTRAPAPVEVPLAQETTTAAPATGGTATAATAQSVPASTREPAPQPTAPRTAAKQTVASKPRAEPAVPVTSGPARTAAREPRLKLPVGAVHRDSLPDDAPAPALVMLAGGTVRIGDADGELADAQPLRNLRLAPFLLGEREVTRGEFRAFSTATGYRTVAEQDGSCRATDDGVTSPDKRANWKRAPYSQDDSHPVTCIALADALAYTAWLSERTGRAYRLPTEAEWEYAARAGSTTAYWWGTAADPGRANCLGCGKGAKERTVPADTFPANAWGLRDLAGNLREWTCSVYAPRYNGAEQRCAAPGTTGDRVVRGGSWAHGPERMRSAYRDVAAPSLAVDTLGFRVALDP
jgi:formylglycine-generating enzyme required for sulfatase activity